MDCMSPYTYFHVKDWTLYPGGRHKESGDFSADELSEILLEKLQENSGKLYIVLDGVRGYALSFLDQLVENLLQNDVFNRVGFVSETQSYLDDLEYVINCHMRGKKG